MYKSIDELVERIDERNRDGKISTLIGVSIDKCFINSVANINGTDLTKYKIIRRDDFAVSLMQVSRDSKIPIARLKDYDQAIMSPAYPIFRVRDTSVILPEYLEMWFMRPEFDREAAFIAVGGVRGSMPWEEFAKMRLPVPSLEKQHQVVCAYQIIADRIEIKRRINDNLEATLTAIFKKMFIEDNTISFCNKKLYELTETIDNRGKTPPNNNIETPYPLIEIASLRTDGRIATYRNCSKFVTEEVYNSWFRSGHPKQKDILMSTVGSLAELKLFWGDKGSIAQNIVAFRCFDNNLPMYLYQYLLRKQHELAAYEIGSVQASIKVSQVIEYDIAIPPKELLDSFDKISTQLTELIYQNEADIDVCHKVSDTLLQRLTL